jgi:hypothetical protein
MSLSLNKVHCCIYVSLILPWATAATTPAEAAGSGGGGPQLGGSPWPGSAGGGRLGVGGRTAAAASASSAVASNGAVVGRDPTQLVNAHGHAHHAHLRVVAHTENMVNV